MISLKYDSYLNSGYSFMRFMFNSHELHKISSVSLFSNSNKIDVLSTDSGFIKRGSLFIKGKECSFDIEYPEDVDSIDCVVSYFDDDYNLLNDELIVINIEKKHKKQVGQLDKKLNWKLNVCLDSDIIVNVVNKGCQKTHFSFGTVCNNLLHSDLIFSLTPDDKMVIIPKEVVLSKSRFYKKDSLLGCFELVKHPEILIDNLFIKKIVSNYIKVSDLNV